MISKKILVVLVLALGITSSGRYVKPKFYRGPKVDCYGKPSDNGKQLCFMLGPLAYYSFRTGAVMSKKRKIIRYENWGFYLFRENNQELIDWEISKYLKKRIFKLKFFRGGYLPADSSCANYLSFWASFPPEKTTSNAKLLLYNSLEQGLNSRQDADKTLFILKQLGSCADKEYKELQERTKRDGIKMRDYSLPFPISGKAEKAKAYNAYLKMFKSGHLAPGFNAESYKHLVNSWDVAQTLRRVLDEKLVNGKNQTAFCDLLSRLDSTPDDIAEKIIKYYGLNGEKGALKLNALLACTKSYNPKLRKAILANIKTIPEGMNPYIADYAIKIYLLGIDKAAEKIPAMGDRVASILLAYARLTGDYNKAFEYAFVLNKKLFPHFPNHGFSLCIKLLYEKSNLSILNAQRILNVLTAKTSKYDYFQDYRNGKKPHIYSRYARLLTISDFSRNPKSTQALAGLCSPEDLNRSLLQALLASENYKKRHPEAYLKAQKLLDKGRNYFDESEGLENLPRLIKILEKNPSESMIYKVCDVLKPLSLYGRPAGLALRELLKKEKLDFTSRIAIMCTLAEIGDKESIPLLKKYTHNKNKLLEKAARQSLYMLQDVDEKNEFFKEMSKFRRGYYY